MPIRVGSFVRRRTLPSWVGQLPKESQRAFDLALGNAVQVIEIEPDGVLVLDITPVVRDKLGGVRHTIMVEPEYVDAC
jgi:hypothetical protein